MVPIDFLGWPFSTDMFWIGDHISLTSFGLGNQFSLTSFGLVTTFHWHVLDWVTTFHWRLLREIWDKKLNLRVKSSSDELKSMLFLVLEPHSMIYVKIVGADTIPLTAGGLGYRLPWTREQVGKLICSTGKHRGRESNHPFSILFCSGGWVTRGLANVGYVPGQAYGSPHMVCLVCLQVAAKFISREITSFR